MALSNITDFHNLHQDKNCFILSSGPSLKSLDLSPLKRRITIGLNRSFMIFPETQYHCVMDERLFELYTPELQKTRYLFTIPDRPFGIKIPLLGSEGFSQDLTKGIYSGYTVSYFALQLSLWMGFKNIFFLGLDLKNTLNETHFFGYDHRSGNHDQTEFPKMIRSFESVATLIKEKSIKVYNCSLESSLDCFEKMSFEKAIKF